MSTAGWINSDQNVTCNGEIKSLKKEKKLSRETIHRKVKYLNNIIESDHGNLTAFSFLLYRTSKLKSDSSHYSQIVFPFVIRNMFLGN